MNSSASSHPTIYPLIFSSIHPPTNSLIDLPIHSSTQPPIHSMHPSIHPPILSSMDPSAYSYPLTHSSFHPSSQPLSHPPIYQSSHTPITYSPTCPPTHPLIYLSIHPQFFCSQFSSVTQSCLTLCDAMDCSTPGLPAHHQLPEFTEIHVHWVGDAIQPSHPLSSPSPPTLNLSQHQCLFKWVSSLYQVAKILEFQLQHKFCSI